MQQRAASGIRVVLLALGGLGTALCAWVWFMRATADVGQPTTAVYVLTWVGPLALLAGLWMRRRKG